MRNRLVILLAGFAAGLPGLPPAIAQEPGPTTVPWAFSSYFGTGWYEVGDDRDAFAIRYAWRKRIREAAIGEDGERRYGVEWRVPVTLGLDRLPLEDVAGTVDPENFANISVTPGLWIDVPVTERFTLRPFAAAGWGTVFGGEDSAWTYWTGANSRWRLSDGRLRTDVVNSIGFVGYTPKEGPSENFWPLLSAIEFSHPLAELDDDELRLVWHVAHTHFHGKLELTRPDGSIETISEQWEAGFALRRRDEPLRIGFLELDRLGLSYRFSTDGELEGIGIVLGSLFDQ